MNSRNLIPQIGMVLGAILLLPVLMFAQDVLWDNENSADYDWLWSHFMDTLRSHGAMVHYTRDTGGTVYYTSDSGVGEGWENLMDMDMLCVITPCYTYDPETKSRIIEFAHNGGKIVIWTLSDGYPPWTNDLITDSGWQTTMEILDTCHREIWTNEDLFQLIPFSPFTDNVSPFVLFRPPIISCGDHAYPFYILNGDYPYPVAAISYPFLHERNCSSYIILVTGTHRWEIDMIHEVDEYRFASNILLTAAGCPGYELEPGAIPGGGNACADEPEYSLCHRTPNPFTPNGDGFYDKVEFAFPGLGEVEGVIKIFTLGNLKVREIEVRAGAGAKQAATWDGTDNAGEPLLQGIYLYIIKSQGRIICKGTVTLVR